MKAIAADRIFDGAQLHTGCAVLRHGDQVAAIVGQSELPAEAAVQILPAGQLLSPGFVDLQVNGGGGVMFNDAPCVETLRRIAAAHAKLGSTAILPTLISSDAATRTLAITAVKAAIAAAVPGIAGLHLEGPFLAPARRGIHPARMITPPSEADIAELCAAFPAPLLITLAPDIVPPETIRRLREAGCVLFAGHSEATYAQAVAGYQAGISGATHLFNAMSQLTGRAPGLVGAAILRGYAGIIADLLHVDAASILIAHRAMGAERLFFVSDAMATTGGGCDAFDIDGNRIFLRDGTLTDANGTLAGAHLSLAEAVRNVVLQVGIPLIDALRMATLTPAEAARLHRHGRIAAGSRADFVALDGDLRVQSVWIAGKPV